MGMFCYQCEQAAKGGCTVKGVCGKDDTTAGLQDLLLHAVKGVSMYARRAGELGARDRDVDVFTVQALFSTLTNVNFDPERLAGFIAKSKAMRGRAKEVYESACFVQGRTPETLGGPAVFEPAETVAGMTGQAASVSIAARRERHGEDLAGLQELLAYAVKGIAAYGDHAQVLGSESGEVFQSVHEMLDYLADDRPTVDGLLGMCMKAGEVNYKAMELLDEANTGSYGHPVPTPVRITQVKGKAVLISGHDLRDIEELLKQTEGKGINVYTHGEMLPAHGYPKLKSYPHLAGNWGGAWQEQHKDFEAFPGAIVMTTNCLQKPKDSYRDRIFTSGVVAWPGVPHIMDRDFAPVIEAALAQPGFAHDAPEKTILTGFARNAVLGVADKVIDAVKAGSIKHFFLVGGCDGAKPGRSYYTDFAKAVPEDCVILTLACGKYRFNKLEFGDIGGIPRLLDIGQCNDAYSAIQIAVALSKAFNVGVNDLPLSLVLSWYEQKAVSILLTLLFLGIKDIRLGPSLPAFLTPTVLGVLVEKFGIKPITTPEEDIQAILKPVEAAA